MLSIITAAIFPFSTIDVFLKNTISPSSIPAFIIESPLDMKGKSGIYL